MEDVLQLIDGQLCTARNEIDICRNEILAAETRRIALLDHIDSLRRIKAAVEKSIEAVLKEEPGEKIPSNRSAIDQILKA